MKVKRKTFPNREFQKDKVKGSLRNRAYVEGKIPKTGRSLENYATQLFPDVGPNKVVTYLRDKNYLENLWLNNKADWKIW